MRFDHNSQMMQTPVSVIYNGLDFKQKYPGKFIRLSHKEAPLEAYRDKDPVGYQFISEDLFGASLGRYQFVVQSVVIPDTAQICVDSSLPYFKGFGINFGSPHAIWKEVYSIEIVDALMDPDPSKMRPELVHLEDEFVAQLFVECGPIEWLGMFTDLSRTSEKMKLAALRRRPSLITAIPQSDITPEMSEMVVNKQPELYMFIPDEHKTKELTIFALTGSASVSLDSVPNEIRSQVAWIVKPAI